MMGSEAALGTRQRLGPGEQHVREQRVRLKLITEQPGFRGAPAVLTHTLQKATFYQKSYSH